MHPYGEGVLAVLAVPYVFGVVWLHGSKYRAVDVSKWHSVGRHHRRHGPVVSCSLCLYPHVTHVRRAGAIYPGLVGQDCVGLDRKKASRLSISLNPVDVC